jgi:hypothetical protein
MSNVPGPSLLATLLSWLLTALPASAAEPAPVNFEREVAPLLASKCLRCHGEKKRSSGLDLRTRAAMLEGGDSGPALVPGAADRSLLLELVSQGKMPPSKADRLSNDQVALLRRWIDAGAPAPAGLAAAPPEDEAITKGRHYWAFQKPRRPAPPAVKEAGRVRTPVDRFLLHRLEEKGLGFAPDADRLTLLRRASFDLTGGSTSLR